MSSTMSSSSSRLPFRSYFTPKPPPLPPHPTRSLLASQNTFLPLPLLETLLNHTPFAPCPPPLSREDQLALDLAYVAPRRLNPRTANQKEVPRLVASDLEPRFRTQEHRRVIKWSLIRGLFREFGKRESRDGSGNVLRNHVKNSVRTSREMNHFNERRDGTLEGRIDFGWETLDLLRKSREKGDGKFLERLTEKVLYQQDAKGLAIQEERDKVKPSGGPIPWARPYGGTWTGSIMQPNRLHAALPRIKPQPLKVSMMIWRREREQNEAFRIISLRDTAKRKPDDKALQEEVNSPLFQHHLRLANRTLNEGRARESSPIPPSLVLACAAARVKTDKYKYEKRQAVYAARWKLVLERRAQVDAGLREGPLEQELALNGEVGAGIWGVTKEVEWEGGKPKVKKVKVGEEEKEEVVEKKSVLKWKEGERGWKEAELKRERYGGWLGGNRGQEGRVLSGWEKP